MRKIIQIISDGKADNWWALCDDGTIWQLDGIRWIQTAVPKIPQDTE